MTTNTASKSATKLKPKTNFNQKNGVNKNENSNKQLPPSIPRSDSPAKHSFNHLVTNKDFRKSVLNMNNAEIKSVLKSSSSEADVGDNMSPITRSNRSTRSPSTDMSSISGISMSSAASSTAKIEVSL